MTKKNTAKSKAKKKSEAPKINWKTTLIDFLLKLMLKIDWSETFSKWYLVIQDIINKYT